MTETWEPDGQDACKGSYIFEVLGQPVTVKATFELCSSDDGCCYGIYHIVKSKAILIGGQVDQSIKGQIAAGRLAEIE